jgi:hypothetical protein
VCICISRKMQISSRVMEEQKHRVSTYAVTYCLDRAAAIAPLDRRFRSGNESKMYAIIAKFIFIQTLYVRATLLTTILTNIAPARR